MGRFPYKSAILVFSATLALAQEPTYSTSVTLVRLVVSVKNDQGQVVGDLQKSDFKVFDSGVPQTIQYFEHHTEVPLSVSILIDTSGSTGKDLDYETNAVGKFIRALLREGNPADAVALYSFNHEVTLEASFTRNQGRLENRLGRLKGESGTALYDAIYLASRQVDDRDGRHVLIIVTDGGDTYSKQTFLSALRTAQMAEAIVYPILVTPITNEPGRNLGGEHVLSQLATDTGGRVFEPIQSHQLDQRFAEILRDLRTQYLLGYTPTGLPPGLPSFHPIRVELNRKELKVSTRNGYYEDTAKR
ncbi:MAG: VWA domain-containing protein [Acidobacteriota bacterium]